MIQAASVDNFLKLITHPLKDSIEQLRWIILSANPGISEHIKRNAPSYVYDGEDRITMNLRKPDQIILLFHRGVKKKDTTDFVFNDGGMLQWLDKDRAMIVFGSWSDIQKDRLTDLVQRRIIV